MCPPSAANPLGPYLARLVARRLSAPEQSEALVDLARLKAQIESAELAMTARWDADKAWALDGALSGAVWLRANLGVTAGAARSQVRTARVLQTAPILARAYAVGELTTNRVQRLAALAAGDAGELFARDEATLVIAAIGLDDAGVHRLDRHWEACALDELSEPDSGTDRQAARQRMRVSRDFHGNVIGDLRLAPVDG